MPFCSLRLGVNGSKNFSKLFFSNFFNCSKLIYQILPKKATDLIGLGLWETQRPNQGMTEWERGD